MGRSRNRRPPYHRWAQKKAGSALNIVNIILLAVTTPSFPLSAASVSPVITALPATLNPPTPATYSGRDLTSSTVSEVKPLPPAVNPEAKLTNSLTDKLVGVANEVNPLAPELTPALEKVKPLPDKLFPTQPRLSPLRKSLPGVTNEVT